jgi:thiamine-phosphate pyrophosphorylase
MWGDSKLNRNALRIYFVMGSQNVINNPLDVLEEALKGGITAFQFREKGEGTFSGAKYLEFATNCQRLCKQYDVPFIVNDDLGLAIHLNADGIHVGQDDLPVQKVRKMMGNKWVGVSVHTLADVEEAIKYGADYVGIGPIFPTDSKSDAKKPSGTRFLKEVANLYTELPIVGIGGITPENTYEVLEAGADGIAVVSAISLSEHPTKVVELFKLAITKSEKM